MAFHIRAARPADGPAFVALVRALADFEKLPPPDAAAGHRLLEHAFGAEPRFELLVAEVEDRVVAYAVFFPMYSTFRAESSLYLEDLFVHPDARRQGIGRAMMHALARLAVARGCVRLEWTVLDWNDGAQRFYRSLGATILREWYTCRMEGEPLARLGSA